MNHAAMGELRRLELVCPAGSLAALKVAVDAGADCVYTGFRDRTNARNFAGLNFTDKDLVEGIRYAHARKARVFIAINTYPQAGAFEHWCGAVDHAAALGADAVIVADAGLMDYAARAHPRLRLHLSVQGSATTYEAINFYHRQLGVSRAVLPRVLTLAQVEQLKQRAQVEIEVFGFGSLCVMVEGRCALSSYVTGQSPNTAGVCSPAGAVRWQTTPAGLESRLNGVLVDRYADGEKAAYPTLCKGRYQVKDATYYAIEEPASLNTLELLPELARIGVVAVKIEGRQRSPAYVAEVTRTWRAAIDACLADPSHYAVREAWMAQLDRLAEGQSHTLGAYHRPWR
jgi:collagenase-like PrtC family protease